MTWPHQLKGISDMSSQYALGNIPKLPARYATIVMPLILSILMSCLVSAVSTLASVGFSLDFADVWPRAWGASWLVAFPSLLVVLPFVRRLVAMVVHQPR